MRPSSRLNMRRKKTPDASTASVWLLLCLYLRPRLVADLCQPLLSNRNRSPLWFCQVLLLCLDCRKCNITFVYNQQELEPEAVMWLKSATQRESVCVAQPPGFGNDRLDIGEPKWRKRAEALSASVRRTDCIQRSILAKTSGAERKLEWAKLGCFSFTVLMLVFFVCMWPCRICI